MGDADVNFYFDPVCPFAWMTSKWVRMVAGQRDYRVEWRFVSLRLINAKVDYAAHFPPEYEAGHTSGLKMLRVAARARAEAGPSAVGPFYEALGKRIFDTAPPPESTPQHRTGRTKELVEGALADAGLALAYASALDDTSGDEEIRSETEEALGLTGRDVGTPIIHFQPPDGVAFFGPVISRLPNAEDAAKLWDHVIGLAAFPGFAEMKRSLRELPQLASLGVNQDEVGAVQDWHGGSRRLKK
ncbi:MAG: DsbA family protein [Acidimicrobiales bacterium]